MPATLGSPLTVPPGGGWHPKRHLYFHTTAKEGCQLGTCFFAWDECPLLFKWGKASWCSSVKNSITQGIVLQNALSTFHILSTHKSSWFKHLQSILLLNWFTYIPLILSLFHFLHQHLLVPLADILQKVFHIFCLNWKRLVNTQAEAQTAIEHKIWFALVSLYNILKFSI